MTIFALSDTVIPVSQLEECLADEDLAAKIEVTGGRPKTWTRLVLSHPDDHDISLIDRYPVSRGLGKAILEENREELLGTEPALAARWVHNYLTRVKMVYSFQVLSGTDCDDGWEKLWAVQNKIRDVLGGILHAEAEGFSNEEGFHITWEFSNSTRGGWNMAVLDPITGEWIGYRMELGNREHRAAFRAGRVPDGVERW